MACEKLLLPIDSIPMVEHVMRAAVSSGLAEILLVYQNASVAEIGSRYNMACIHNGRALDGQSASIRLGVAAARADADAYMFLVGDQPFVRAASINQLIAEHCKHPDSIIVPCYGEKRATPTLFPQTFRAELLALQGDSGGRQIMARRTELVREVMMDEMLGGVDIDTPEGYQQLSRH
jgi:molybdenum cofactor cytidylyltransferase